MLYNKVIQRNFKLSIKCLNVLFVRLKVVNYFKSVKVKEKNPLLKDTLNKYFFFIFKTCIVKRKK